MNANLPLNSLPSDFDLYDDVFNLAEPARKKQKCDEDKDKENSKYESIFNKLRAKNAELVAELDKQKKLAKSLSTNFYSLLTTARREITKKDKEIKLYKSEKNAPFVAKCPKCRHKFNATDDRPPKPTYVRVLQSKGIVEVSFHKYEDLSRWVTQIGLARNSDNLPTLPEEVAYQLSLKSEKPTLTNAGSILVERTRRRSCKKR